MSGIYALWLVAMFYGGMICAVYGAFLLSTGLGCVVLGTALSLTAVGLRRNL